MPQERLSNSDIKRCMFFAYVSESIVDYIDNTAKHAGISRAEAMRNFIPTSKREWKKYINMEKVEVSVKQCKRTISCNITDSEYAAIKEAQKMSGIISTNEFFETIFSKKMMYLIKQAQKYKTTKKPYKAVVFHTTKAQSAMLEASRLEYNKNHDTNYSKSRFLIMVANGEVKTYFNCTGYTGDNEDTTITLNFYPSDMEVFKARYGGRKPNSAMLRDILNNTLR